jgi:hypothetical protein
MPAAAEQLTAAQLDEVEPLWAQPHAHHAALAMPPAMRESNGEALDVYARLGAQPAFVIMALP